MIPRWGIPVEVTRLLVLPLQKGEAVMSCPYWKRQVWQSLKALWSRSGHSAKKWSALPGAGDVIVLPCQHDEVTGEVRVWDIKAHDWRSTSDTTAPLGAQLRIWFLSDGVQSLDLTRGTVEVLSKGRQAVGILSGIDLLQLDTGDTFISEPGGAPLNIGFTCKAGEDPTGPDKMAVSLSCREVWACASIIEAPEMPEPYVAHIPSVPMVSEDDDDDDGSDGDGFMEPEEPDAPAAPVLPAEPEEEFVDLGPPPRLSF